jgi:hypothetical protein
VKEKSRAKVCSACPQLLHKSQPWKQNQRSHDFGCTVGTALTNSSYQIAVYWSFSSKQWDLPKLVQIVPSTPKLQ